MHSGAIRLDLRSQRCPDWAGSLVDGGGAVMSLTKSALSTYRDYENMLEDLEDESLRQKFKMETRESCGDRPL